MHLAIRSALVVVPLLMAGAAQAHIQLDSPLPHFVFDNGGIETNPCGSGTVSGAKNPPLTGGDPLLIKWHETINHDGHYRIALSANQSDFTVPTSLTIPAPPLPSWDLVDGIPDTSVGDGTFSKTITVPNIDCPHCVLQLVQIAALSADGSNSGGYYTNYYECADLSITASPGGTGGAAGTGGVAGTGGRGVGTGGSSVGTGGSSVGTGGRGVGTGGGSVGTGGSTATGTGGAGGAGGPVLGGPSKVSSSSSGCDFGAGSRTGTRMPLLAGMLAFIWLARRRRSRP